MNNLIIFYTISKCMICMATHDGSLYQAHQLTSFLSLASPADNSTHGQAGGYGYRPAGFEPRRGQTKGNSTYLLPVGISSYGFPPRKF